MDESEEIDYLVGLVTATDQDDVSTPDGVFTYSIPNQPAGFPFKIDASTGNCFNNHPIALPNAK